MSIITNIADLEALYGVPGEASLLKVAHKLTPEYRAWIMASKFCVLSTAGPGGTDGSPRGDDGPVVVEQDETTLLMPDWRGNNRMDSLRNIVADGHVSLMFMIPGRTNVIRLNGTAVVSIDSEVVGKFENHGQQPRSVIIIKISEIYSQCARALMRAGLWGGDYEGELPSMGDILKAQKHGAFDGATYDADWAARAKNAMW